MGIQLADVLRPGALAPMRFLMLTGPGELLFTFPVGKMYENGLSESGLQGAALFLNFSIS